jgi:hypothetical protein
MISCSQVQAALSARLDGEPSPLADDVIDAHVSGCAECRWFLEQSAMINRQLAFGDSRTVVDGAVPDLADQIIAGVEPQWRRQRANRAAVVASARVGLAVMTVLWFLWAGRLLVATAELDPLYTQYSHLVIESVAMRCALGFGVAFIAWLPRLAQGVLPLYGAVLMFSLGFSMRDVVLGLGTVDSFVQLGLLFLSTVLLAVLWLADRGWALVASFGARPTP